MRVLVTGHRGYIGACLTPRLAEAGHDVTGLDSDLYRACDFGPMPVVPAELIKDIRDLVPQDLAGFDAVIHLAGLSNDPLGDLDPALTQQINTDATLKLARLAKAAGIARFVFSSSCSSYGAAGQGWLSEDAPLNPVTPYAVSKVDCEEGLARLADADFCPVFLRSATAYGASPRLRFDLVANNLTAWAVATGHVRLKSDGRAWRPLVHVEDIAQAFVLALDAPSDRVRARAFNVGVNEDCMQIRDLALIVKEAIPEASITFAPEPVADARTYRVDCTRLLGLGFQPQWTVRRGIAQLRDLFRAQGVSVEDFEGERYQRVAHIRGQIRRGDLTPDLRRRDQKAA